MRDLEKELKEPLCYLRNTLAHGDLYLASDGTLVPNKLFAKKFTMEEVEDIGIDDEVYEPEFIEED